jgi:hypothetical protein
VSLSEVVILMVDAAMIAALLFLLGIIISILLKMLRHP